VIGAAIATGFVLDAAGVAFPGTVAMVGGAVVLVTGGPLLTGYVRRRVLANLPGSRR
jgi:hypothetical protein